MEERVPAIFDVIYIKNGNDVKVMKTDYFYAIHFFREKDGETVYYCKRDCPLRRVRNKKQVLIISV